jgi:hypothetical protein
MKTKLRFVSKLVLFSAVALIASSNALALSPLKAATVKITSATTDQTTVYHGSGLIFQQGGIGYVVTSDHVVLHSNVRTSHTISNDSGTIGPCDFVIADFGRGLALLKAQATVNIALWPQFSSLKPSQASTGQNAVMMGFPALARNLIRDASGKISNLFKPEDVLVQIPKMVEVQNGHAEFGMSGGVVADLQDGLVGLLSDQEYSDASGAPVNTILAVPASEVLAWLSGYLQSHSLPSMVQSTYQQIDHTDLQFSTGSFAFTYLDAFNDGGKEFNLYLLSSPVSGVYTDKTDFLASYAADLQKRSIPCPLLYLFGFRPRGEVGGGTVLAGTVDILRKLNDPTLEPLTKLECDDSDSAAGAIQAQIATLDSLVSSDMRSDVKPLLSDLDSDLGFIRASDPNTTDRTTYVDLKPSDVNDLIVNPIYKTSWSKLKTRGQSAELLKQLNALIVILRELTI